MIFQYLAHEAGLYPVEPIRSGLPILEAASFESHLPPPPPTRARHQLTRSAIRKEAENLLSVVPKLDIDYEDQLIDVKGSKYVTFSEDWDQSDNSSVTYFPVAASKADSGYCSSRKTANEPSYTNTSKKMSRKTLIDSLSNLNQRKKDAATARSAPPIINNNRGQVWRSNSIGLDARQGFSGYLSSETEKKPFKVSNEFCVSQSTSTALNDLKRVGYVKSVSIPTTERKRNEFILKSKSYHHPTKQLHVRSEAISMTGFNGRGKFAGISCWKRGYGQDIFDQKASNTN